MLNLDAIKERCKAVTTKGPGYSDSDGDTEFLIYARADVPALVAEVERLQRKLHDAQVRQAEWKKMYDQAIEDKEIE